MDLLQEYNKTQPKIQLPHTLPTEGQLLAQRYAPDAGFFVRLVMKLSGGRIQNTKQASIILLIFAMIVMIISLFLFFGGDTADFSPDWTPYTGR
ncbi:MAG: hypothetical protein HY007_00230 [Candidatus Sungbacteria bacterium]|nr:hypothetical protein [Candidatus Sungbacteria bacterium]